MKNCDCQSYPLPVLEQLVADLKTGCTGQAELQAIGLDALEGQFDLVINATSASLSGDAFRSA